MGRYVCVDCGKSYAQRASLVRHRAGSHLGLKRECHCGRAFTQSSALLRHQRAVHEKREHACDCGRAFASGDALRKHTHAHHWTPEQRCRNQLGGWCATCWKVQLGFHSTWQSKQCAECSGVVSTQRYFLRLVADALGEQWMPSSLDNVVLGGCGGVRRRRPDVGFLFKNEQGFKFVDLEVDEDGHARRDPLDEMLKVQDTASALPGVDVVTIRVDVPSEGTAAQYEPLAQRAAQCVRAAIACRTPPVEFVS